MLVKPSDSHEQEGKNKSNLKKKNKKLTKCPTIKYSACPYA